jgi:hypothetical protein
VYLIDECDLALHVDQAQSFCVLKTLRMIAKAEVKATSFAET